MNEFIEKNGDLIDKFILKHQKETMPKEIWEEMQEQCVYEDVTLFEMAKKCGVVLE